jgi:hypothetical protein
MILLSIIQSLRPSGYLLEKKKISKKTQDIDDLDGRSIEEMMVRMAAVEDQYLECNENVSRGAKNKN